MKKKNMIVLEPINVSIERSDLKTVRHIAIDEDVTPSQIFREAIRGYLEQRKSIRPADPDPATESNAK